MEINFLNNTFMRETEKIILLLLKAPGIFFSRFYFITAIPFLLLSAQSLSAVSWAILPVKLENFPSNYQSVGPQFNPDDTEAGWEMAKAIAIFLKANDINAVLPVASVRKAYIRNNIGINSSLTERDLRNLSGDIDADKILLTEIYYTRKTYRIESRTYFKESGIFSDSYTVKGENLFLSLGDSLRQRFSFRLKNIDTSVGSNNIVFGIDGSGKNYEEIKHLDLLVRELDVNQISAITIDGYNKSYLLKPTNDKGDFIQYVNNIQPKSTDTTDLLFPNLLDAVNNLARDKKSGKTIIFLLVSGAPKSMESRQRTNGYIRRFSQQHNLIILGNGKLTSEERNYWVSLVSLRKSMYYTDLVYKQKIGLSDGSELYALKSGNHLLESNVGELDNSHNIAITTDLLKDFTPDNISFVFENATQKKIVSTGKVQISYNLNSFSGLLNSSEASGEIQRARILLIIENKPFWISIPYRSTVLSNSGLLRADTSYHFLLNLTYGGHGMPFQNSRDFGQIIDATEVSEILMLDIDKFLKNPENFLGKSISGSSVYIIFGKVKEIQLEKKVIY